MNGWQPWGAPAAAEEPGPAPVNALVADRYCPRCDRETRWTNEHDQGVRLACAGCGFIVGAALSDEEEDRAVAYDETPVVPARRAWVFT